ncbi:MAG: MBL fold metallo-hydrolase [Gemmataceae bacterium]
MAFRFAVLASGSAGNAGWIEVDGFGLLLDGGLRPRELGRRLEEVAGSWRQARGVLLTHTHGDHWNNRTLRHLRRSRIPLYCHPGHHDALRHASTEFSRLCQAGLVHDYEEGRELTLAPSLTCQPIAVRHDSGPTFGFRFTGPGDLFGQPARLAYVSDLGCWDAALARALAEVDVLAVEFNHDVELQYASGRHPRLIARVLGDEGHLSNQQAAALVREIVRYSTPGRLRHVVQLHLSGQCNRPSLAVAAVHQALADGADLPRIHTAHQDRPGPMLRVETKTGAGPRRRATPHATAAPRYARKSNPAQPWLPGLE